MMDSERFWKMSYDQGLTDLDGRSWETSLVEAVKEVFARFPEKTALACMGTRISFAVLDRCAERFAHLLKSQGFVKGDVVGINLPNIPEFVIAWLGALRAGCVVTGVSPLHTSEGLAYQLKDCRAKGLVTLDAIYAGALAAIADDLPDLKLITAASIDGFLSPLRRVLGRLLKRTPSGKVQNLTGKTVFRMQTIITDGPFPSAELSPDLSPGDIAFLPYTGGTTGAPKPAMLSHRNVLADVAVFSRWLGLDQGQGIALSLFPYFHMAGQLFLACCLYNGIAQVLIPNPRDSEHVCRQIRRCRPTVLAGPPSLLSGLIDNPAFGALDFSALDYCICGADPFPEDTRQTLERIIGPGKVMEVYGLTETSALIAANPCHGRREPGSIGLPLPNTDIRLIDPATGKPAALGQPGQICVDGPQVMAGYYNRPKVTRQSFDAAGYFHTGDMAVQDAHGYLRIVDRTRDMIRAGGFTVFSLKVEGVLCRHPAVHRAAAIGAADPENPETMLVKAFVTLKNGYRTGRDAEALKEEILTFAADKLTPYELPESLDIRAELPLTILGHVDKQALRREMRPQGWTGQERRTQTRGMVDLPCDVRGLSNGRSTRAKGHVANVNREGMFIEAEKPLDQGTQMAAQITVIRFGNTFWVKGEVLRTTERGIAVRFREGIPPEIDTILHPEGK